MAYLEVRGLRKSYRARGGLTRRPYRVNRSASPDVPARADRVE